MTKSLFDQSQDIDKQIEALKRQKIELKAQLDKVRIKKLDEAGIESEEDLDILLGLQPSEKAMDEGQDVYSSDGQVMILSRQDQDVANVGYVMYKLDNGNVLLVKADSQGEIRDEFEKVADDLAKTIDSSMLEAGSHQMHADLKDNQSSSMKDVTSSMKDHHDSVKDQPASKVNHEEVDMNKYQKIVDGVMSHEELDKINQLQEKLNRNY